MKIALLSNCPERIAHCFAGDETAGEITPDTDFVVSFNHNRIIRGGELARLAGRMVNVHISLLPWGRGTYPNFWAWFDGTPHGVTIHQIDGGIDTGPILAQRTVDLDPRGTLRTTHTQLMDAATDLFVESWPAIRDGRVRPIPQLGSATYHIDAEMALWLPHLPEGWDTPVSYVRRLANQYVLSSPYGGGLWVD